MLSIYVHISVYIYFVLRPHSVFTSQKPTMIIIDSTFEKIVGIPVAMFMFKA